MVTRARDSLPGASNRGDVPGTLSQACREREETLWWEEWREGRDMAAAVLQAVVRGRRIRKILRVEVRLLYNC